MGIKRFTHIFFALAVATCAWAQGPNGSGTYYQNANGQKGEALKTALSKIISTGAKNLGYKALWDAYKTTDLRPDGTIWDIYSNITKYDPETGHQGSYKKEGDMYNREHTTPQSWFGKAEPMRSDLFHVYPTDGYVNNKRGSFPLGETNGEEYKSKNGFSKLGQSTTPGYNGTVFEPADEFKGDLARAYFYMATRYEDKVSTWSGGVYGNSSYPGLAKWALDMFIRWSGKDPVSQKEVDRNKAVYKLQMNRNPYVDYPGLEQYVWGTLTNTAFDYANYVVPNGNNKPYNPNEPNKPDEPKQPENPGNETTPPTGAMVFHKVTSASDLQVGKYYLIVNETAKAALSATNKNFRAHAAVEIAGNAITTEVNAKGKPHALTLGGTAGNYTWFDATEKMYLAYTGPKNSLNNASNATAASAQWQISIDSEGNAVITNKQATVRMINYNGNDPRFACYMESNKQKTVQLYVSTATTDIRNLPQAETKWVNVYSIDGRLLRANVQQDEALTGLPKGMYIVGTMKYVVR
jgi:extracellular ribonuclease